MDIPQSLQQERKPSPDLSEARLPGLPVVSWLHELPAPRPLALPVAGQSYQPQTVREEVAAIIGSRLAGVRLVGLGEASHGSSEFARWKTEIIQNLIGQGVSHILIEAPFGATLAINDYVTGKVDGNARELVQGIECLCWKVKEVVELVEHLSYHNKNRPPNEPEVQFIGIDVQGAATVLPFVEALMTGSYTAEIETLREALRPFSREEWCEINKAGFEGLEADRLQRGLRALDRIKSHFDSKPLSEGERYKLNLALLALEGGISMCAKVSSPVVAGEPRRDHYMALMCCRALDGASNAGARGVVWAHDSHVGRISNLEVPGWDAPAMPRMGHFLSRELQDNYRVIGFEMALGSIRAWDSLTKETSIKTLEARESTICSLVKDYTEAHSCLLDFKDGLLASKGIISGPVTKVYDGLNGPNSLYTTPDLLAEFDHILFSRTVTPSQIS